MTPEEIVAVLRERERSYTEQMENLLTATDPGMDAVRWFSGLARAMRHAAQYIERAEAKKSAPHCDICDVYGAGMCETIDDFDPQEI